MQRGRRNASAGITLMVALVRMREEPVPHCWQRRTSLFSQSGIRRRRFQKSPFRRCFKPRPPLSAGCAGFASGCRSRRRPSWTPSKEEKSSLFRRRLSGLLSGPHRSTRGHRHVRNWATQRNSRISLAVNFFAVRALPSDDVQRRIRNEARATSVTRTSSATMSSPPCRSVRQYDGGRSHARRSAQVSPQKCGQPTSTFLNCQGSLVSTSSGNRPGRPVSGVQSV